MIPESAATPSFAGTLVWDGDWLVLQIGPWEIAVADVEEFSDGGARAHLHGWSGPPNPMLMGPGLTERIDHRGRIREGWTPIDCATRDEGFEVIRALLGVRGVVVPPRLVARAASA